MAGEGEHLVGLKPRSVVGGNIDLLYREVTLRLRHALGCRQHLLLRCGPQFVPEEVTLLPHGATFNDTIAGEAP